MNLLHTLILGVVEGLTEFLPVSSTGHLIVASKLLRLDGANIESFEVFIQLGAIAAVALIYKEKIIKLFACNQTPGFAGHNGILFLVLTTIPALALGAVTHSFIKMHLFNPVTVSFGLGLGGVAIIFIERSLKKPSAGGMENLTKRHAFLIGLFQCLALWPGISRSASTILGGMILGLDRKTATEYSFFAAIPVMCAAATLDLLKSYRSLARADLLFFLSGFIFSFVSAWIAVRWFIQLVSRRNLSPFGWYRIVMAPVLFWFFTR